MSLRDRVKNLLTLVNPFLPRHRRYLMANCAPLPFRLGDPALCWSHPYSLPLGDLQCFFVYLCTYWYFLYYLCTLCSFSTVLWYCWLGLLTCKTVSHITYTVLETLNHAQSIWQQNGGRIVRDNAMMTVKSLYENTMALLNGTIADSLRRPLPQNKGRKCTAHRNFMFSAATWWIW